MVYTFDTFVLLEALNLKDGFSPNHYKQRRTERIENLEIIEFKDLSGNIVKVDNNVLNSATQYFRKVYSAISDPESSKIFNDITISNLKFGLIYLGKPIIVLQNGNKVTPIFKVPLGKNNKSVTGSHFWISTDGSTALTILLQEWSTDTIKDKSKLISDAVSHVLKDRANETDRKIRISGSGTKVEDLIELIGDPIDIKNVVLDLSTSESIEDQANNIITSSKMEDKDNILYSPTAKISASDYSEIETESKKYQMNLTPGKVWQLDFNDKFGKWGAYPIENSKLDKDMSSGNSANISLGPKHIYWIEGKTGMFAPPKNIVINKGDKILLAKQLTSGTWAKYSGTVTGFSTDTRSTIYPFVMCSGGFNVSIIDPDEVDVDNVFKSKTNESSNILNFDNWINLNF